MSGINNKKGRKIRDIIDEIIFPSNIYCICCGSLIDNSRPYGICDNCVEKLHWNTGRVCRKCGKAIEDDYRGELCYDCREAHHYFERGFSCLTYGLYERQLMMEYKYNGKGYFGKKFGDILYDRISCEDINPDVIIPVPVHKRRERARGYNQAQLMAKRLGDLWRVDVEDKWIERNLATRPLRGLSAVERANAMQNAFRITESGRKNLTGKTVLVVDDIYTTGATVDSCSRKLMEGGADKVYVLTLASGGNRKPAEE